MPCRRTSLAATRVELARVPQAVRVARRLLRTMAGDCGGCVAGGPAELLLSEVVSNAVRYARGSHVDVVVAPNGTRGLMAAVFDEEPHLDRGTRAGSGNDGMERGRGLDLIEALSDTWGVTTVGDRGKWVWFTTAAPA
ncbi:ATP-binding protein [Kitasatospora sp. NPDC048365]|uniref:ATP-binding protein n=1 Tax=Kitasatospora sp. NPDC048365 TaxID=3364050 RepID=UPI0037234654